MAAKGELDRSTLVGFAYCRGENREIEKGEAKRSTNTIISQNCEFCIGQGQGLESLSV
jgi:hypothetical protein